MIGWVSTAACGWRKGMEKDRAEGEVLVIREEPIALYKLLKLGNLVASGGEAKSVVSAGLVRVNGAVETRKGRKIYAGDRIDFEGMRVHVTVGG